MVHSFQQDGVLAEPGRRADGSPAEPLATLTARATQTMLDVHGFRIKMIEKPFHVTTRDDPAILEIVKGLAHPLDPADMPRRPVIAQVGDTPIRPTAQQMRRSAGSGAAAAARRATTLERQAMEAAARAGDAILAAREADAVVLARAAAQLTIADDSMDEIGDETADEASMPDATSAAAPAAEASGAAEMGNGDDEADAEASDTEREPDESDAVVEAVPMSVSDPEQAPVTQVAQVAQEDAGDAGDADDSDAPAARRGRNGQER